MIYIFFFIIYIFKRNFAGFKRFKMVHQYKYSFTKCFVFKNIHYIIIDIVYRTKW